MTNKNTIINNNDTNYNYMINNYCINYPIINTNNELLVFILLFSFYT